jgi:two-component system NarL family response regulator
MRVLLVDDHSLVIEGIRNFLVANGVEVLGVAADGLKAVAMAERLHPDVILMDVRMPRCDGLAATRLIMAARPDQKIIMLTTSSDEKDLFEAVKSGAQGYLLKSISPEAFLAALRDAEEDIPPFSPEMARLLLKEFASLGRAAAAGQALIEDEAAQTRKRLVEAGLTERQAEVLQLVAEGLTYAAVGLRLSLTERTVRFHMTQIMNRLHLHNRAGVLAYAREAAAKPAE